MKPVRFVPLSDISTPTPPADESARRWLNGWWFKRGDDSDQPLVGSDAQRWVPPTREGVAIRDCDSIREGLADTLRGWINDPAPQHPRQLFVWPPGCRRDPLIGWAAAVGHEVIHPPQGAADDVGLDPMPGAASPTSRETIDRIGTDPDGGDAPVRRAESPSDPRGDGGGGAKPDAPIVVLPHLERWFTRCGNGFDELRTLLDRLALSRRRAVVGCSSWSWHFLRLNLGAGLVLPTPLTFKPFNTDRTAAWLRDAMEDQAGGYRFRSVTDGSAVFGDGEGDRAGDVLDGLNARAMGVPWLALDLFRRSLRRTPESNEELRERFPETDTLWVDRFDEFKLREDLRRPSMLVLHSLLVHNGLRRDALRTVLPGVPTGNLVASLVSDGFVEHCDGRLHVRPAAYPDVREALTDAGFPADDWH